MHEGVFHSTLQNIFNIFNSFQNQSMNNSRNHFTNFIFVTALCFFSLSKGNTQIVYVDIPDTTVYSNPPCYFDLDGDGIDDFEFSGMAMYTQTHDMLNWQYVDPINNDTNAIVGDTNGVIHLLQLWDTIDNSMQNWNTRALYHQYSSYCSHNTTSNVTYSTGTGQGCLGVRFLINNQIHYGWIRVDNWCGQTIISDWAYNSQPDSAITAGQIWTGINSSIQTSFASVTSFNHSILVHLNENAKATISIYDCLGQLINKKENASGETKMEMEYINPGIYFVEVVEGDKFYSKRIYLQ